MIERGLGRECWLSPSPFLSLISALPPTSLFFFPPLSFLRSHSLFADESAGASSRAAGPQDVRADVQVEAGAGGGAGTSLLACTEWGLAGRLLLGKQVSLPGLCPSFWTGGPEGTQVEEPRRS